MNDYIRNVSSGKNPEKPTNGYSMADYLANMGMADTAQHVERQFKHQDAYNQALDMERKDVQAKLRKGLFGALLAIALVLPPVPSSPIGEAPPVPLEYPNNA
jgi:hypothetical protein